MLALAAIGNDPGLAPFSYQYGSWIIFLFSNGLKHDGVAGIRTLTPFACLLDLLLLLCLAGLSFDRRGLHGNAVWRQWHVRPQDGQCNHCQQPGV